MSYPLRVTIHGSNFLRRGNRIEFGPVTTPDVGSVRPGVIAFAVPKVVPSHSELPPAVLPQGAYPVTVTTPAGTSNALTFMLTEGFKSP